MTRHGAHLLGGDGFRIEGFLAALVLTRSSSRRTYVITTLLSLVTQLVSIVLFTPAGATSRHRE